MARSQGGVHHRRQPRHRARLRARAGAARLRSRADGAHGHRRGALRALVDGEEVGDRAAARAASSAPPRRCAPSAPTAEVIKLDLSRARATGRRRSTARWSASAASTCWSTTAATSARATWTRSRTRRSSCIEQMMLCNVDRAAAPDQALPADHAPPGRRHRHQHHLERRRPRDRRADRQGRLGARLLDHQGGVQPHGARPREGAARSTTSPSSA